MNSDVVRTIEKRCRRCYNCVRYCPAKAIKVSRGQAVVVSEKCIGCGNCVKVCTQNAKEIQSNIESVREHLSSGRRVVACLAPSFPAELGDNIAPGQLVASYKKMGFHKVVEVAFGADLVGKEYRKICDTGAKNNITTSCPAVVYYVTKYIPEMIPYLVPVVSPMIATGKVIKAEDPDAIVVFIGPCIAKKKEARDPAVSGIIDEVLTFQESAFMRRDAGIKLEELEPMSFDPPHPSLGRAFPIAGGCLRSADFTEDVLDYKIPVIDGREHFLEFMNEFHAGRIDCLMSEILFCEGCVNGPVIKESGGSFDRKKKVSDYIRETLRNFNVEEWQYHMMKYSDLDLSRVYVEENIETKEPSPDEIQQVLISLNKFSEKDELNCKACGYDNCRALARAIYDGIAENEMCLPYSIEMLESTLEDLNQSHKDLQTTQNQLIQTEKQASLGQLAAGVAHEVNNPLGTILLYTDLLANDPKIDERSREDVSLIAKEAKRCKSIVSGLLDFSRQRDIFTRKVDVNTLLRETVNLVKNQKPRGKITYIYDLSPELPLVEMDPEQIKQVSLNLIMNAIEAMNEEGIITIKSEFLKEQGKCRFSVSDNGPGIPQENQKKLFTPFFTTKQIGHGTGLGLAICYGIIKMHRGDIHVETTLGNGASFVITLPILHGSVNGGLLGKASPQSDTAVCYQPRRFSHFKDLGNKIKEANNE